jgi:hypothetical protein
MRKLNQNPSLQTNSVSHDYRNKFNRFQSTKYKTKDGISDGLFSGYSDVEPENLRIIRMLGQLLSPFEESEKLLEHHDEQIKVNILHKVFVSCLDSHKPVKFMDCRTAISFKKGIKKIAQYTSTSMNMPVDQAEFELKELVKGSVHFKNHIK